MQALAEIRNCEGNALARRGVAIIVDVLRSLKLSSNLFKRTQSLAREARNDAKSSWSREQQRLELVPLDVRELRNRVGLLRVVPSDTLIDPRLQVCCRLAGTLAFETVEVDPKT